jgi:hypothetical protein
MRFPLVKIALILAFTLIITFTLTAASCGKGTEISEIKVTDTGGIFTLTGIPSKYNGKYATFMSLSPLIAGWKSIEPESPDYMKLVQISKGSVTTPLWRIDLDRIQMYSGNDDVMGFFQIFDTDTYTEYADSLVNVTFLSVIFKKGIATKAWKDGTVEKK